MLFIVGRFVQECLQRGHPHRHPDRHAHPFLSAVKDSRRLCSQSVSLRKNRQQDRHSNMVRDPSAMEPMLPGRDGDPGDLADLALALVAASAQAAGRRHPITEATLRDLLRTRPGPAHRRRGEPSSAHLDTPLPGRQRAHRAALH